jgi:hypothetical protein
VSRSAGRFATIPVTRHCYGAQKGVQNSYPLLRRGGRTEPYRLLAQSDSAFQCTCGLGYIFARNANGMAPTVDEVHVTGGWTFNRVP